MMRACRTPTIAEIMIRMSDAELIEMLTYIRNSDGEKPSIIELKHVLRETLKRTRAERQN